MKKIYTLALTVGLLLACAGPAASVDFKAKGQFLMGFGGGETSFLKNKTGADGRSVKGSKEDGFAARQRILLQLEAIVSDNLAGVVQFHIGPQQWGKSAQGGALGADGTFVKVRQAYVDWQVPSTALRTRMGIQSITLPNAAGGSAIFDTRSAAINAHYAFNSNVGLTALWMRPFNDNYSQNSYGSDDPSNYLDNMDLFALMLPLNFDGVRITPWAMYGMMGRNAGKFAGFHQNDLADGYPGVTLTPYLNALEGGNGLNVSSFGRTSKAYGNMFWAGLPLTFTLLDPWRIEFDFNYGHVEGMERFEVARRGDSNDIVRGSSQRQGWLGKALVEYATGWGVPGVFAWYGSGDDGNVRNGSERMPSICPYGNFTSFLGDGNLGWAPSGSYFDRSLSYAGTWGLGLQIRDVKFLEDISHTFRVAYWGGTNSPSMVKYMDTSYAWDNTSMRGEGPYMTTNDGLLEFNIVNKYKIYENLNANLELGYVANFMDDNTWKKSYANFGSYAKQDIWKAQLIFEYKF